MVKIHLLPRCKVELIPLIFGVTISRARKDLVRLHAESSKINEEFLNGLDVKNEVIKQLVPPQIVSSEKKAKLKQIQSIMRTARPTLNSLDIKLGKDQTGLIVLPTDMGIHEVRESITKKKVPAFLLAMGALVINIEKNAEELSKRGFTAEKTKILSDIMTLVDDEVKENQELFEEHDELSESNIIFINEVWADIREILRIGKLVFCDQTAKVKEYTFDDIKRRFTVSKKKKKDDDTKPNDQPNQPTDPQSPSPES